MSWIRPEDKMPPEGLQVLVEASGRGRDDIGVQVVADHDFYLASWIHPVGEDKGHWLIDSSSDFWGMHVHAWMPLPKPYEPQESEVRNETDN